MGAEDRSYDSCICLSSAHEKMNIIAQEAITYTLDITQETAYHLARMTPMLAGIDVDALNLSGITEITIDETLYIGSVK